MKYRILAFSSRIIAYSILSFFLIGCSAMPSFGPSSETIEQAAQQRTETKRNNDATVQSIEYQLTDLNIANLPLVENNEQQLFSKKFINQSLLTKNHQVIPGDVLEVRLWEAAENGLFSSGGNKETLFNFTVANNGTIIAPYAGMIHVDGFSTQEIRSLLLQYYDGRAVSPEITVDLKQTESLGVSVLGSVSTPGFVAVSPQGITLLDLLSKVGGIPYPDWEVTVKVTRNNSNTAITLSQVLEQLSNNIIILPGDYVHVSHTPRQYSLYGAVSKQGSVAIDLPQPSLSDLLAAVGGLNDRLAESRSVFVFRTDFKNGDKINTIPNVYRLNFSQADAFLLASQFKVQPQDIVYVATAGASEFNKFITTIFSPFFGGVNSVQSVSN